MDYRGDDVRHHASIQCQLMKLRQSCAQEDYASIWKRFGVRLPPIVHDKGNNALSFCRDGGASWPVSRALALSLLVHLGLVLCWPGYGGQKGASKVAGQVLRARLDPVTGSPAVAAPVARKRLKQADRHNMVEGKADRLSRFQSRTSSADVPARDPASLGTGASSPAGADLSGEEDYIPVELLDVRPAFLRNAGDVLLPEGGENGSIVLQLLVGKTGLVDRVVLEHTDLSVERTREILQQLGSVRLLAGKRHGKPVKCRWRMEFSFTALSGSVR